MQFLSQLGKTQTSAIARIWGGPAQTVLITLEENETLDFEMVSRI
jgi:hypothetical protein